MIWSHVNDPREVLSWGLRTSEGRVYYLNPWILIHSCWWALVNSGVSILATISDQSLLMFVAWHCIVLLDIGGLYKVRHFHLRSTIYSPLFRVFRLFSLLTLLYQHFSLSSSWRISVFVWRPALWCIFILYAIHRWYHVASNGQSLGWPQFDNKTTSFVVWILWTVNAWRYS